TLPADTRLRSLPAGAFDLPRAAKQTRPVRPRASRKGSSVGRAVSPAQRFVDIRTTPESNNGIPAPESSRRFVYSGSSHRPTRRSCRARPRAPLATLHSRSRTTLPPLPSAAPRILLLIPDYSTARAVRRDRLSHSHSAATAPDTRNSTAPCIPATAS